MISKENVDCWQRVWSTLLNMTYHGKDIVPFLRVFAPFMMKWKDEPNFEEITFDYMWKVYSKKRKDGEYIEPDIVPELKEIHVPRILFDSIGVHPFMKTYFPNCEVHFWEE